MIDTVDHALGSKSQDHKDESNSLSKPPKVTVKGQFSSRSKVVRTTHSSELSFNFEGDADEVIAAIQQVMSHTLSQGNDLASSNSVLIPPPMQPVERTNFAASLLGLSGVEGLGFKGVRALDKAIGIENVWQAEPEVIRQTLHAARIPQSEIIAHTLREQSGALIEKGSVAVETFHQQKNVTVLSYEQLPLSLQMIDDCPRWLFVQGNVDALDCKSSVALVGTRTPSPQGVEAAIAVCDMAAAYPLTIVSGLAEGIDEVVHEATLDRRRINVAFLGHGVNVEFPAKTVDLRHRIVEEGGAVATEYLPDERYQKQYFVQRNRLQAALADAVIPVEAAATSGTAHTVRFARKYNRPLIGIRWDGENGILAELEQAGAPIFDVFSNKGKQGLDAELKGVVERSGGDAYPFARLERLFKYELKLRNARKKDVDRLLHQLRQFADETLKVLPTSDVSA